MCVYVYICVCMRVCMGVCVHYAYVCMHACVPLCVYMCTCVYVCEGRGIDGAEHKRTHFSKATFWDVPIGSSEGGCSFLHLFGNLNPGMYGLIFSQITRRENDRV